MNLILKPEDCMYLAGHYSMEKTLIFIMVEGGLAAIGCGDDVYFLFEIDFNIRDQWIHPEIKSLYVIVSSIQKRIFTFKLLYYGHKTNHFVFFISNNCRAHIKFRGINYYALKDKEAGYVLIDEEHCNQVKFFNLLLLNPETGKKLRIYGDNNCMNE